MLGFTKDLVLQEERNISPTVSQDNRPSFYLPIIELLEFHVLDTQDKNQPNKKTHGDLYSNQPASCIPLTPDPIHP